MQVNENKIKDVLRRMEDSIHQSEATKACFGILSIMSREKGTKSVISREGMEIILNAMSCHMDKVEIQESGCDLVWSLAFNDLPTKEIIAKHGGSSVLVRALKRHSRNPEFLKSACGAISNICQCRTNQEGISAHGGLQPLISSIQLHQNNELIIPYLFDAIASLIVGNEDNGRNISLLGYIQSVLLSMNKYKNLAEIVKSGCHSLAILSDIKGQASKIAFAGGVSHILLLLDIHPSFVDFHRVAAVGKS